MIKPLQKISLVFENCDAADVYPEDIYNFAIDHNFTQYSLCNSDQIHDRNISKFFFIVFNDLENLMYSSNFTDGKEESLYERITKFQDITHVHLYFGDEDLYLSIPWKGNDFKKGWVDHNYHQDLYKIKICEKEYWCLEITDKWHFRKIRKTIIYFIKKRIQVFIYKTKKRFKNE